MALNPIYGFGDQTLFDYGMPSLDGRGLIPDYSIGSGRSLTDQISGFGQDSGFGLNLDTARLGLAGLGTLGNLYGAFQANKLAKKQYNMTKKVSQANLSNSIQSYNTTLEDRYNARAATEGRSAADAVSQYEANRLKEVTL